MDRAAEETATLPLFLPKGKGTPPSLRSCGVRHQCSCLYYWVFKYGGELVSTCWIDMLSSHVDAQVPGFDSPHLHYYYIKEITNE